MKKLMILAVVAITMVACTTTKQAEPEKTQAQQLMERLDTLRQKGYMFGHQDDPFYLGVRSGFERCKERLWRLACRDGL